MPRQRAGRNPSDRPAHPPLHRPRPASPGFTIGSRGWSDHRRLRAAVQAQPGALARNKARWHFAWALLFICSSILAAYFATQSRGWALAGWFCITTSNAGIAGFEASDYLRARKKGARR